MVDNLIRLYNADARDFTSNGLGSLNRAVSCTVIERRNGEYELELVYAVDFKDKAVYNSEYLSDGNRTYIKDYSGNNISIVEKEDIYDKIGFNMILVAKPTPYANPQPFRIYSISKPIDGLVTINAQHISYDLSGVSVSPFSANSVVNAFNQMKSKAVGFCPFTFWTDIVSSHTIGYPIPMSMRSILGGTEGSILDIFGGEYEFDNFVVKLHQNRGSNSGVSIRYGKNLTDITQDENCNNVYTEVYPYWYSESDEGSTLVELPEKTVKINGTFNHTKVLTLDLTQYFDSEPTKDELRYMTQTYINAYRIGVPDISLTVSFAPLSQTTEYKSYSLLERINLCDIVTVEFPEMGISATAQCIETRYDVLADKYISIELGNARSDLSASFESVGNVIKSLPTKSFLQEAIDNATKLITGQSGGYVVLNPPVQPSELLIMDQPTIEGSTKVWRWNAGGLGYSSNGYNGPYALAMTMDGSIVADFINTGTLNANLIKAGMLTDFNNTNYWDLTAGKALFTNLNIRQGLNLVDENNFKRVNIGYNVGGGSDMRFFDGVNSRPLINLAVPNGNDQDHKYPIVALGNRDGDQLCTLGANDAGGTFFITNPSPNKTTNISLYCNSNGGVINVNDSTNHNRIRAFTDEDGGYIRVSNNEGTEVISLLVDGNGDGTVIATGGLYGNYMGKKWVRTTVYFDSIPVDRTWGSIYCSIVQQVNYVELGITNIDNIFISLLTMSSGMWAWPVNTKQDDTYIYFVLARPTSETCEEVKISILIVGD